MLATDRPLLAALLVSCVFWLVSGISLPIVNRLGSGQLGLNKFNTSLLVAAIAFGIAIGAIISGTVFKRLKAPAQVTLGLFGICFTMIALGCWGPGGQHLLGFGGCFIGLLILGTFAAIYSVPLQVFLAGTPLVRSQRPHDCNHESGELRGNTRFGVPVSDLRMDSDQTRLADQFHFLDARRPPASISNLLSARRCGISQQERTGELATQSAFDRLQTLQ